MAGIDGEDTIELTFADYGSMIPSDGFKTIDGERYYMKNYERQTGWIQPDGVWYYLDSNGMVVHDKTMVIDNVSYTFGSQGEITNQSK